MARLNKTILIVGRKGSGKTTFCKKLIGISTLKVLVVDTFAHPSYNDLATITAAEVGRWQSGNARIVSGDPVENLDIVFSTLQNAMVVCEDAKRYLEPNIQKPIKRGIIEHRNRNIDLVFMFHSLRDIPPYLCANHTDLILFKTNENMRVRQDKFSNWDELAAAHTRIMAHKNDWHNETISIQ